MRMFGHETQSGEKVTVNSALGVPAVYACVNILANGIATLPMQTFKRTKTETRKFGTKFSSEHL